MIGWLKIALIAAAAGILTIVLVIIFRRCFLSRTRQNSDVSDEEGTPGLHQVSPHHQHPVREGSKKSITNSYQLFQRGVSAKRAAFSWAEHPSVVTEAVENGWSRFAFTSFASSPSPSPPVRSLLGACVDLGTEPSVEVGWEVSEGSADFMQRISLNPNPRKIGATVSVIRAALPLPGPNLGNSSFPQEAYFEITILSCNGSGTDCQSGESEGDKIKLIGAKNSPDFVNRVVSSHSQKRAKQQDGRDDTFSLSVGLSAGNLLVLKVPGSYPGSVGFNSTASVHLDGTKLIFDSTNHEWGRPDKVIGCGYNPNQKKVFFTVDSQLVHEIHCMSDEFSSPLYPTIAANTNAVVLVNLGQSPFKFGPANLQRTPNPCFIRPLAASSPALGYEDSRELFSMGRIDSQWRLHRNTTRNNTNTNTMGSIRGVEYDQESEGDLFEIVLETTARSPYTAVCH